MEVTLFDLKDFIIISGHYGCGKTNLSINMALDAAKEGKKVTLVDMDLVNPYFRSSDYKQLLQENGIQVIAPAFAGTNLDLPSLAPNIYSIFEKQGCVILDVGGDDVGSTVLGRFRENFDSLDYDMLYVVNQYRNLTAEVPEAVELLKEIEHASRLKATAVVNNSHLKWETEPLTILNTGEYAQRVADAVNLPLIFTTVPREIEEEFRIASRYQNLLQGSIYPIEIHVRTSWEFSVGNP